MTATPIAIPPAADRPVAAEARLYPEAAHFYIPTLDGIRAVAFAIVFVAHAGWGKVVPGGLGVTIFFFLSGYLITTLLRREGDRTGTVSLRKFYLRRVLRILPPFYTALAAATLLVLLTHRTEFRPLALAAQALQVSNYYLIRHQSVGIAHGFEITWSLSVEEHFYLLFPLLYLALRRVPSRAVQAAALLGLCGVILAWRCVLAYRFGLVGDAARTYMASDTRFDSILFGCALAVCGNPMLDRPAAPTPRRDAALAAAGLLALLVTLLVRDERFRGTLRYTLQGVALIPLFVAAIRHPGVIPFRWLNHPAVRFLGVLSYSLYLVHDMILDLLKDHGLPRLPAAAIGLAASLAIAYAMYRFIERPCGQLRRRIVAGG